MDAYFEDELNLSVQTCGAMFNERIPYNILHLPKYMYLINSFLHSVPAYVCVPTVFVHLDV